MNFKFIYFSSFLYLLFSCCGRAQDVKIFSNVCSIQNATIYFFNTTRNQQQLSSDEDVDRKDEKKTFDLDFLTKEMKELEKLIDLQEKKLIHLKKIRKSLTKSITSSGKKTRENRKSITSSGKKTRENGFSNQFQDYFTLRSTIPLSDDVLDMQIIPFYGKYDMESIVVTATKKTLSFYSIDKKPIYVFQSPFLIASISLSSTSTSCLLLLYFQNGDFLFYQLALFYNGYQIGGNPSIVLSHTNWNGYHLVMEQDTTKMTTTFPKILFSSSFVSLSLIQSLDQIYLAAFMNNGSFQIYFQNGSFSNLFLLKKQNSKKTLITTTSTLPITTPPITTLGTPPATTTLSTPLATTTLSTPLATTTPATTTSPPIFPMNLGHVLIFGNSIAFEKDIDNEGNTSTIGFLQMNKMKIVVKNLECRGIPSSIQSMVLDTRHKNILYVMTQTKDLLVFDMEYLEKSKCTCHLIHHLGLPSKTTVSTVSNLIPLATVSGYLFFMDTNTLYVYNVSNVQAESPSYLLQFTLPKRNTTPHSQSFLVASFRPNTSPQILLLPYFSSQLYIYQLHLPSSISPQSDTWIPLILILFSLTSLLLGYRSTGFRTSTNNEDDYSAQPFIQDSYHPLQQSSFTSIQSFQNPKHMQWQKHFYQLQQSKLTAIEEHEEEKEEQLLFDNQLDVNSEDQELMKKQDDDASS